MFDYNIRFQGNRIFFQIKENFVLFTFMIELNNFALFFFFLNYPFTDTNSKF